MSARFGWDQAADNYAGLYGRAIGNSIALRWRAPPLKSPLQVASPVPPT